MKLAIGPLVSVCLAAGAIVSIAFVQPKLSVHFRKSEHEAPVYALPSKERLALLTLGYREAAADYLFGSTLVEAGIHFIEHRPFDMLGRYLEAVVTLDPYYRDVYYYADALLTLSTVKSEPIRFVEARKIAESGLNLFPFDEPLWRSVGEFMTYLAPPELPATENVDEWKATGAKYIAHSCSLSLEKEVPPWCFTAARVLSKSGAREASIAALERVIRLARDPETVREARVRLEQLLGLKVAEEYEKRRASEELAWRREFPFVSRELYELLGKKRDVFACAGASAASEKPECARVEE